MKTLAISPATALAEAHGALLDDVAELERLVERSVQTEPAEVRRRLEILRGHLGKHFRFEEENGYMQAVLARAPHKERRVRQLREEHDVLWQSLAGLVWNSAELPARAEEFRQALREWVGQVRDHEERENLLVERQRRMACFHDIAGKFAGRQFFQYFICRKERAKFPACRKRCIF